MTSTSRIARCGPACRVVWQGRSCKLPPMPIANWYDHRMADCAFLYLYAEILILLLLVVF
jgi:hypothetical protein